MSGCSLGSVCCSALPRESLFPPTRDANVNRGKIQNAGRTRGSDVNQIYILSGSINTYFTPKQRTSDSIFCYGTQEKEDG